MLPSLWFSLTVLWLWRCLHHMRSHKGLYLIFSLSDTPLFTYHLSLSSLCWHSLKAQLLPQRPNLLLMVLDSSLCDQPQRKVGGFSSLSSTPTNQPQLPQDTNLPHKRGVSTLFAAILDSCEFRNCSLFQLYFLDLQTLSQIYLMVASLATEWKPSIANETP